MSIVQPLLSQLVQGHDLTADEAHAAFSSVMEGECTEVEIAALLTALRVKGESVNAIVGAARAMRERATPIKTRHTGLLDTCGTGGDELHTFNISTAAAFVVAASGVPVPKHGNRGVSSKSGSADVLETLGVNINLSPEQVSRCIDELMIGFCFAPLLHGAMRHAAPVRKQLKFRTIFNLLGPLTNPAKADYQLVGAARQETAVKLAQALAALGRKHAIVVCGANELDEVSLWGTTLACEVRGLQILTHEWTAETFGLPACSVADLQVDSAAESADVIRRLFAGEKGAARNIVLANAAAGLMAAEKASDPKAGVQQAAEAIDSGKTLELLNKLIAVR